MLHAGASFALAFALTLLVPATVSASDSGRRSMHHATGTFEIVMTPEAQVPAQGDALPTSRMALLKTFSGPVTGTVHGTMLAAGTPAPGKPAAYVAIDQFAGTVDGKSGGFVLLHRGTMDAAGKADLSVVIAPDSGTGALAGIAGTLSIEVKDGRHQYDLAYTLPETGK